MTAPRAAARKPKRRVPPPILEQSLALMLPLGPVVSRGMFGGWGLYLDGMMFALIAGEALYLKTDEDSRARFAAAGARPFVYQSSVKQVETSYWRAPADSLDHPESLRPWAELALAAARRAAARKPARRKARTAALGAARGR